MSDYIVLQPVHLGSGQLGEARKKVLEYWAKTENCFWNSEPSIGRLIIKLIDERRPLMAYYCTGGNGSFIQLEDGRFADTVLDDTSENGDAHNVLELLLEEAENIEADWQDSPLFGDFSEEEMQEYCGAG